MSDIELPAFVEQRFFYVFLEDKGAKTAIAIALTTVDAKFDVIQTMTDRDAVASVTVLSRLNNPNISDILPFLLPFL